MDFYLPSPNYVLACEVTLGVLARDNADPATRMPQTHDRIVCTERSRRKSLPQMNRDTRIGVIACKRGPAVFVIQN